MNLCEGHSINLPVLLETRLLIQANSGGGKSYALRRLLEQTAKGVQQLVIDSEGEFATLREKFDYVIAAPHDGDAVATPQTAALLARRLLESGVSAILDIYDLKAHERILFVRRFLESLVNAPRSLWHPCMVVLDEAHVFAPQTGSAESAGAVIDVATRGRKRGLCLVVATQRLSKLHKDVAAEMINKLIGRTGLDVDVKRAADELGMSPRDALAALRDLAPGEFYAFGPALGAAGIEKIAIGPVETTHPKSGQRLMQAPPPASAKLLSSLAKLADLQKEAEQEARTVEELKTENAKLRREATIANKRAEQAGVPEKEVQARIATAVAEARKLAAPAVNNSPNNPSMDLRKPLERIGEIVAKALTGTPSRHESAPKVATAANVPRATRDVHGLPARLSDHTAPEITAPQQKILDVLAQLEAYGIDQADKAMVAAHAGVSPTSGGFFNNLGRLRSGALIDYPSGGKVALTILGRARATPPKEAPQLYDLHESWLRILPAPQATILRALIEAYPEAVAKDDLADRVGVSRTSGGYFNNLGRLRTLGAIDYPSRGQVAAAAILFPETRA